MPGCVAMVIKDGKIAYHKAFGHFNYDSLENVTTASVYDMASVTKICATTLAVMKLYEEGKIDLKKNLGDYLGWVKGSNKEKLTIENLLLHQAGLSPFIPFYKEVIDSSGTPYVPLFAAAKNDSFKIRVAHNLFLRNDWKDTMYQRILQSPLTATGKYVYSDNDFIFLGKIVETITDMPLDEFVQKEFYTPLALATAGFKPGKNIPINRIAPTENETIFRKQLIRGDVHDPGAAMFGGVSGHAGLFSNAFDMAVILQMLLNGGAFNGKRYLQKTTIDLFTAYHSNTSRRGFGFDKPEKDNYKRAAPYPCKSASSQTFGHTGFTGTCVWADPAHQLIFIFLSNRITPSATNNKLTTLNSRSNMMEAIYKTLK
jgi:beta-N-acetylhexosaminidase